MALISKEDFFDISTGTRVLAIKGQNRRFLLKVFEKKPLVEFYFS